MKPARRPFRLQNRLARVWLRTFWQHLSTTRNRDFTRPISEDASLKLFKWDDPEG